MWLRLIQPFPFLFLRQQLLLFCVFSLQLLRLQLMLLVDLQFLRLIRLMLRQVCVLLILLLLVPSVQLGIRGGLNNGPRRSRNLVRMNCQTRNGLIGLRWLRAFVRVHRTIRWAVKRPVRSCSVFGTTGLFIGGLGLFGGTDRSSGGRGCSQVSSLENEMVAK